MQISFDIEKTGSVLALVSGKGVASADHSIYRALAPEIMYPVSDDRSVDLIIHRTSGRSIVRYQKSEISLIIRATDTEFSDLIAALTGQTDQITVTVNAASYHAPMASPSKPNVFLDEDVLGFGLGIRL